MSEKEEDRKLLAAIAQGDKKAYEALFRKYYAPMVLFADGMLKDRMESAGIDFHNRVRQGYLELAKQEPQRIKVIDAAKSIEEIHAEVIKIFEEYCF